MKKSYDQRLKKRWKERERQSHIRTQEVINEFGEMDKMYHQTSEILSILFGKIKEPNQGVMQIDEIDDEKTRKKILENRA